MAVRLVSKVSKFTFDNDNRNIWHSGDTVQKMKCPCNLETLKDQISFFLFVSFFPPTFYFENFKPEILK